MMSTLDDTGKKGSTVQVAQLEAWRSGGSGADGIALKLLTAVAEVCLVSPSTESGKLSVSAAPIAKSATRL